MSSKLVDLIYWPLEWPLGYKLIQWLNHPTVRSYRAIIALKMDFSAQERLLDLGCGIGNFRPYLKGRYTGVDLNPAYIDTCRKRFADTFQVMDATDLKYDDAQFDQVAAIALTHHLPDRSAAAMVKQALRVLKPGGRLHIVEPILPGSRLALFKTFWFKIDRGRFARRRAHLASLVAGVGAIEQIEEYRGLLHDVCYLRVASANEDAAASAD